MTLVPNNDAVTARLLDLEERVLKLENIISEYIMSGVKTKKQKKPQKRGPKMPELINVENMVQDKDKLIFETKYGKEELNLTLKQVLDIIKIFKAGNEKYELIVGK